MPHRSAPALARLIAVAMGISAVLVAGGSASTAALTPLWEWPLAAPHAVVRPFIAPASPYASGHRGIDIAGVADQPVVAPADGVVHFAGWVVDRPVVSVRHPGGLISSFEPVTSIVAEGDRVTRGQLIGVLEGGHCPRACLHFGARRFGEYVSPLLFLGGIPRSVLLPTRALD
ncbi:MAG TPA: M23 family metallopeptidase [Terrimesophilobacter sp.]|nr:M23 family metallopeptidase [Terrimesophilobacter sp.]HRQ00592.1 M23 family metallopeptidase [Terrimesophilobacter sp.]